MQSTSAKSKNLKAQIKLEFALCCAYCGVKSQKLTLDHVLAESKGGIKSRQNLVPACARCNKSKGSKHLTDWYIAKLPFYCQKRLQKILSRSDVNLTIVSKCAKGFG
ncbi:HNH endonuclease [Synechocystis sp. PCC 7509]|uniref:HNH endonuclease n=1 Tax=Synechocystis sp. PCC 7509 TaxID=927677 RepID=UPI0002ACC780|nr:HNH endonuclease [Synechocystis sp. PCC 7509]